MRLATSLAAVLIAFAAIPATAQSPVETEKAAASMDAPELHPQGLHSPGLHPPGPGFEAGSETSMPPSPTDGGSQPVPEPSTLLLVGTGLVGVALSTRWRRRRDRVTTD